MMKCRVYILAYEEKVFHPGLFDGILSTCPDGCVIVGAAMVRKRKLPFGSLSYLVKMSGLGRFASFAVKQMARKGWMILTRFPQRSVRAVFLKHGVPLDEDVPTPNDKEFLKRLKRLEPDVILCSVPNILKPPLLALPALGCVNRHAGRLPTTGAWSPFSRP